MDADRQGTLVILACHGVFDAARDTLYSEYVEDRPIYEDHISYAFRHLRWRAEASPLLVISGGYTKAERRCSESRSYLEAAEAMGIVIPYEVALDECSLTSVENVLFSLYVYRQRRGVWPAEVEAVSWEFKRFRFEKTLEAIGRWSRLGLAWPPLRFFPVGDLFGKLKTKALQIEKAYTDALEVGIDAYYQVPETQKVVQRRDLYGARALARQTFAGFPLPFAEI